MTSINSEASRPIDTNVKIPAAVLRGAAAADEIHKQAYTAPVDPNNPDPPPPPAPLEPIAPAAAAPAAPAAPVPDNSAGAGQDSWENRYKSIKGRYDRAEASLQQQQNTISTLEARLNSTQDLLSRMQAAPPAPAAPAPAGTNDLVTPEDINTFGPDFMDVVARVARQQFGSERASLLNEIDQLKRQVGGVANVMAGDAQARMLSTLTQDLPEWRTQNEDPQFLAWLRLPDPYSGAIRGELLKQAFARNDTARVLAFFKGFRTEEATVAPVAPSAPASSRPSLENFAAPGRAKSEAAPSGGSPEKPIISTAQIAQFYRDVQSGKYAGRDDEKNKLEKQIFDAQRDGRIR